MSGSAATTKTLAQENLKVKLGTSAKPGQSFTMHARSWHKARAARVKEGTLSPTTYEIEGYWIGSSIENDPIGAMDPARLNRDDLTKWKRRQGLANATLRKRCGFLNQILRAAGATIKIDLPRKEDHQRRPLTPAERSELRKALQAADLDTQLYSLLCWQCGLRGSEACAVKAEDFDGAGFHIRRAVVITKGTIHVKSRAKTSRSHGWVPVPPEVRELIKGKSGFLVGDGETPETPKSMRERLKRRLKGTSLESVPYMGGHALRRTYGMTLLEVGADVVTAAKAMRHDPKMLLDEYARSRPDLMQEAVQKAFGS